MKDRKGQALVEFVIIIPVFILLISCIVDFGRIIYEKYQLQNNLDVVTEMYKLNKNNDLDNYLNDIKADMNIVKNNEFTMITLNKNVDINTIIINSIVGKKYKISVNKTIIEGDSNG